MRIAPLFVLCLLTLSLGCSSGGSKAPVEGPDADLHTDQRSDSYRSDSTPSSDLTPDVPFEDTKSSDSAPADLGTDRTADSVSDIPDDVVQDLHDLQGDQGPDLLVDLAADHLSDSVADMEGDGMNDGGADTLLDVPQDLGDLAPELQDADADANADAAEVFDPIDTAEIVEPPLPDPILNEVNCHGQDFVEIKNRSADVPADLTGYVLADGEGPTHRYVLPAGTVIPPLGRIVLVQKTTLYPGFPFGIQCGTDTLRLLDPNENLMEQLVLPLVMEGNTWSRLPDGDGPWAESTMTPYEVNQPMFDLEGLLFNPFQVITIRLAMPQSSIDALWDDPRTFVTGTFSMQTDEFTQEPIPVGLRIKGKYGSFQTLDHKSALKVKFNFADKDLRFQGLKRLTLNNMVQDPSMIHEALAYRIFRGFGVPCPRVGYAQVFINEELYGLYLVLEAYDDVSMSRHFSSTQHVYEGEYGEDVIPDTVAEFEVDEGDPTDIYDLTNLAASVSAEVPDEQWLAALDGVADVEELLRMWAVEQYIGHWDGYAPTINNYYIHCDDDDFCSMLPNGTDQTFSDYRDVHHGHGYLFQRCMTVPECRWLYDQTMGDLVASLGELYLDAFAMELSQFLTPWAESDPRKPYSNEDIANHVQSTRDFIANRRVDIAEVLVCLLDPLADLDGDGFFCEADCNEADPTTNVGAYDVCGDGIDQDCSGLADDSFECPDCIEVWRGPHRYLVCPNLRTQAEAVVHCQENSAELVEVDGPQEAEWLRNALKVSDVSECWMGFNDQVTEGTFVRRDGTVPDWFDWSAGEPNDAGGEDCTEFYTWGQWNDIGCGAKNAVACEDVCLPAGLDQDNDGATRCNDDCDDGDPAIHPGVEDVCGDGVDNDCDGLADNGPGCIPVVPLVVASAPDLFVYLPVAATREEARNQCLQLTPPCDLAWFDSHAQLSEVRDVLSGVAGSNEVWIGVNDLAIEGAYVWADEADLGFTNWTTNQPNNGGSGQDCCRMLSDGSWNDTDCGLYYATVCRLL